MARSLDEMKAKALEVNEWMRDLFREYMAEKFVNAGITNEPDPELNEEAVDVVVKLFDEFSSGEITFEEFKHDVDLGIEDAIKIIKIIKSIELIFGLKATK